MTAAILNLIVFSFIAHAQNHTIPAYDYSCEHKKTRTYINLSVNAYYLTTNHSNFPIGEIKKSTLTPKAKIVEFVARPNTRSQGSFLVEAVLLNGGRSLRDGTRGGKAVWVQGKTSLEFICGQHEVPPSQGDERCEPGDIGCVFE